MHVQISEYNPIFDEFETIRINQGYTTFKGGIIAAMQLFIKHYKEEKYELIVKEASNIDRGHSESTVDRDATNKA